MIKESGSLQSAQGFRLLGVRSSTIFSIDIYLSCSLSRFALTRAWTLVALPLADLAPGTWRDTGLKSVYKSLRREVGSIVKAVPRWKEDREFPSKTPCLGYLHYNHHHQCFEYPCCTSRFTLPTNTQEMHATPGIPWLSSPFRD
ncbi:hypothetical protein BDR03DRAFT_976059 [Suillus americanus]|nr:hypothetical protein BDR03DRAFT_976059 [Suillus americanus]